MRGRPGYDLGVVYPDLAAGPRHRRAWAAELRRIATNARELDVATCAELGRLANLIEGTSIAPPAGQE